MTYVKTDLDPLRGHDADDFPLSFRDRNWELVRYSWDEKTGLGSFSYEHKYTGGTVEEKRYQGKYWLQEEVRARLMPAPPSHKHVVGRQVGKPDRREEFRAFPRRRDDKRKAALAASQVPNGFHTKEAR